VKLEEMRDSPAVQKWLESLSERSGEEIDWQDKRVELVKGFCEYIEKTPDDLVHYIWLKKRKDGLRSASSKRRQEISQKIEEYVKQTGQMGHDANAAANTLRSFLIHNGIFMAGTAFRG
jgi:hypothetical protein